MSGTEPGAVWPWILLVYLVASAITFAVYAHDKRAAVRGAHRVSERTLHWLALVGGWPGALLAQRLLRHKTRKPFFRTMLRLTIGLHVVLLAALAAGVPLGVR
ncbi:MAG: DUF1294 domain-containing protein [Burkholderiales bacterium]